MPKINPQAFTLSNSGLLKYLITQCDVCQAYNPNTSTEQAPSIMPFNGLWDTGASASVITNRVAQALGLTPTGMSKVSHAQGTSIVNTYIVNIILPNGIQVCNLKVSEGNLPKGIDMLIGMDVISLGDFVITHRNGGTVFSFQIPSTHEYNFVKQINNGVVSINPATKPKHKKHRK